MHDRSYCFLDYVFKIKHESITTPHSLIIIIALIKDCACSTHFYRFSISNLIQKNLSIKLQINLPYSSPNKTLCFQACCKLHCGSLRSKHQIQQYRGRQQPAEAHFLNLFDPKRHHHCSPMSRALHCWRVLLYAYRRTRL